MCLALGQSPLVHFVALTVEKREEENHEQIKHFHIFCINSAEFFEKNSIKLTISLAPFIRRLDKSLFVSRGIVLGVGKVRFDRIDANCSDISFKNAIGSLFSLLLPALFVLSSGPSLVDFVMQLFDVLDPGEA